MNSLLKQRTTIKAAAGVLVVATFAIVIAVFGAAGGLKKKTSPPAAGPAADVEVVQVERRDVPIYSEWIGTLDGMVNADVKAQVQGYLLARNYTEGTTSRRDNCSLR